jgi:hypothetical protein
MVAANTLIKPRYAQHRDCPANIPAIDRDNFVPAHRETIVRPIKLSRFQNEFLERGNVDKVFVGGIASGKTFIAIMDLFLRAKPRKLYMIVCRTVADIKDTIMPTIEIVSALLGRQYQINRTDFRGWIQCQGASVTNGARITIRSPGNGPKGADAMRGPNLAGAIIEEATYHLEYVIEVIAGRLRGDNGTGWLTATMTPKGTNSWCYREFIKSNRYLESKCSTLENPFVDESFLTRLVSRYGRSNFARQELEGIWIGNQNAVIDQQWIVRAMQPICTWDEQATAVPPVPRSNGPLWGGYDVGGYRHAAAIATLEELGPEYWLRYLKASNDNYEYSEQKNDVRRQLRSPGMKRMAMDQGSQGDVIYKELKKEFPTKLIGRSINKATRNELAQLMSIMFQTERVKISSSDRFLEIDLQLPSWDEQDNTQVVIEEDRENGTGHADRFIAIGLALNEAIQKPKAPRVGSPIYIPA